MKPIYLLHPFLFALYPPLFLYAANKHQFDISSLLWPIAASIALACVATGCMWLLFRNINRAAIAATALTSFLLSYNRLAPIARQWHLPLGNIAAEGETLLWIAFVALLTFLLYETARLKERTAVTANQALAIASVILVALPSLSITLFEIETRQPWTPSHAQTVLGTRDTIEHTENQPDIYYLIFDRYGGQHALQEHYGFDNTPFISFLEDTGFYVASESTTNYPRTFLSLASSMNMEYLDFLEDEVSGRAGSSQSFGVRHMNNNKVVEFLKERNYQYIHVGSWWTPTASNEHADINFSFRKDDYSVTDEFTDAFLNTTIASLFIENMIDTYTGKNLNISESNAHNLHRRSIFYGFETLQNIPSMPGPKFVFAHVLIPHDPYVLDGTCRPISEETTRQRTKQENYLDHVRCANAKIEDLVKTILVKSSTEPVIIIQADEGPFPMNDPIPNTQPWAKASDTALREKFPILNAYYLPGISTENLYPSITPVNSFRFLFNEYFGTNMDLLPDRNYAYQDERNYYTFTEVTGKVKQGP